MAAGESPSTLPPTVAEKAAQALAQTATAVKTSEKPENLPVVSENFTASMLASDFSYNLTGTFERPAMRVLSPHLLTRCCPSFCSKVNGSPLNMLRTVRRCSAAPFSSVGSVKKSLVLG
jgi:hypothetical protein